MGSTDVCVIIVGSPSKRLFGKEILRWVLIPENSIEVYSQNIYYCTLSLFHSGCSNSTHLSVCGGMDIMPYKVQLVSSPTVLDLCWGRRLGPHISFGTEVKVFMWIPTSLEAACLWSGLSLLSLCVLSLTFSVLSFDLSKSRGHSAIGGPPTSPTTTNTIPLLFCTSARAAARLTVQLHVILIFKVNFFLIEEMYEFIYIWVWKEMHYNKGNNTETYNIINYIFYTLLAVLSLGCLLGRVSLKHFKIKCHLF